ncbi:LacI family DNA-binding transcriptional regulator [Saccharopolyspora rosea]|uniref:LacI family DNA-binding transcriptional regulator n=1 Tax=Saccharopolyspora rosea TaxID=524884 RepID=A0ABW3G2C3_9PSEU
MTSRAGRTTIVDVARAAGTSVSSASVALRGEPGVSAQTRERILAAARRLGYRPDRQASLLRRREPRVLGVTFSVEQTFHGDLVENLYRAADASGYDLVLSAKTAGRPESRAVDNLLRDRCGPLILIAPELPRDALAQLAARTPVVTIGSDSPAEGVDSVHSDDRQGVTDAVAHLVGLGHRRIAYVDGGTAVMSATRSDAYVRTMREHGLDEHVRVISAAPTEESGIEVATGLLDGDDPLPTAILAHNDLIAVGLLLTLRSRGVRVPDDVSVVGYDDTRTAALATVRLTSVSQDAAELARRAVERATTRGDDPAQQIVTPARLVVRDTTAPPGR